MSPLATLPPERSTIPVPPGSRKLPPITAIQGWNALVADGEGHPAPAGRDHARPLGTFAGLMSSLLGLPSYTVELRMCSREGASSVITRTRYVDREMALREFARMLQLNREHVEAGRRRVVVLDQNAGAAPDGRHRR